MTTHHINLRCLSMCLVYFYGIELLASTCKAVCTILSDVYMYNITYLYFNQRM